MPKCRCGRTNCVGNITWGNASRIMWVTHGKIPQGDVGIYYDANFLIDLISESRRALDNLAETKEGG